MPPTAPMRRRPSRSVSAPTRASGWTFSAPAPAAGRAGRRTRASPAGAASSSWARSRAPSRRVPTATARWPAKKASPSATGCDRTSHGLLEARRGRDRAGPAGSPGRGNGGRARCRRARPSSPSSPRSARSPAPARCAGSASRRPPTPPGPSATRSSSPPPSPTRTAACSRRARRLDQHRHARSRRSTAPGTVVARAAGCGDGRRRGGRTHRAVAHPGPPAAGGDPVPRRHAAPAARGRQHPARRSGRRRRGGIRCPARPITWRSTDPRWPRSTAPARSRRDRPPAAPRCAASAVSSQPSCRSRSTRCPRRSRCSPETASARRPVAPLPGPVKAQVVSRGGRPMAGVTVRFPSGDEPGVVDRETDTSDADGSCRRAGPSATGPAGSGSRSRSTASRRSPRSSPPKPIRCPGTRVSRPWRRTRRRGRQRAPGRVAVRVTDSPDTPFGDVPVTWEAAGGAIVGEARRAPTRSARRGRAGRSAPGRACSGPTCRWARRAPSRASCSPRPRCPGPAASLAGSGARRSAGRSGRPLAPAELRVTDRRGNPGPAGRHGPLRAGGGAVVFAAGDRLGRDGSRWRGRWAPPPACSGSSSRPRASNARWSSPRERGRARPAKAFPGGHAPVRDGGPPAAAAAVVAVSGRFGNAVPGALVTFTSRRGSWRPRAHAPTARGARRALDAGRSPRRAAAWTVVGDGGRR